MNILVTGDGGFLGHILRRDLIARGHQVISFNRGHTPVLTTWAAGRTE